MRCGIKLYKGMKRLTEQNIAAPIMAVLLYRGVVDPDKNDFVYPKGNLAKSIRLYRFLGKELRKVGFEVVDPLSFFTKYSGMSLAISEWDQHPNYLANYFYAKSIFNSLKTKEILIN